MSKVLKESDFGYNPKTNHFVRKDGPIWKRLVKDGTVDDPDLLATLKEKALVRKLKPAEFKEAKTSTVAKSVVAKSAVAKSETVKSVAKLRAQREARKLIESHQSELDGMESEVAEEHIRKLLANRLTISDEESSAPEPTKSRGKSKAPLSSRIRLKSQPIPIPSSKSESEELTETEED